MNRKEYHREYYLKNKERFKHKGTVWKTKNRDRLRELQRRSDWNSKLETLKHYSIDGTPQCECCGERHIEFLTIDHIHGGGNQHRKNIGASGGGAKLYRWIKKQGYPNMFRVLCLNCNASLGWFGYCPHGNIQKEVKIETDNQQSLFS